MSFKNHIAVFIGYAMSQIDGWIDKYNKTVVKTISRNACIINSYEIVAYVKVGPR